MAMVRLYRESLICLHDGFLTLTSLALGWTRKFCGFDEQTAKCSLRFGMVHF